MKQHPWQSVRAVPLLASLLGACDPGWAGASCELCVRFVDVDASPGGDGLTWATGAVAPFVDIEDTARMDYDGDTNNLGSGPPWTDLGAFENHP